MIGQGGLIAGTEIESFGSLPWWIISGK